MKRISRRIGNRNAYIYIYQEANKRRQRIHVRSEENVEAKAQTCEAAMVGVDARSLYK